MADPTGLAGNRFLVIGRAGMDLYADPPGTRLAEAAAFTACLGGSSANIAAGLVRQGAEAALVTRVSDDAVGRFVLNRLDAHGIDRRHVRTVGGEARNSLAVVDTRLEDHSSVIYRNGAADFEMSGEDLEGIDWTAHSALITTGTVFAAEPSRSAAFRAFDLAKAAGLPLIFDIDYRPYSWASAEVAAETYSRAGAMCDIIVGNDVEFGFMAGSYEGGLDTARALVADGARIAVYKRGELGAVTISRDAELRTGVFPTEALKPTGAGDAFLSGFVAALAQGRDLRAAVLAGSAAAAIVVARVGCAPAMPTRDEIAALMAAHPEPVAE